MTDLHTALARLEEAGIETPTAVAKWETWFHGEAPFAGHSVVSDTADAAILALADLACEFLARLSTPNIQERSNADSGSIRALIARLSA